MNIVERLRAFWPDGQGHQIAWEAAAEIERLREAIKVQGAEIDRVCAMALQDKEEIERLRAIITRAKDALLDGQSTQWVHDLLIQGLRRE